MVPEERGNSPAGGIVTIMVCMGSVDALCPTWKVQGRIYSLQTDKGLSYLYNSLGCPASYLNYRNLLRKPHYTALSFYSPLHSHISSHPSTSNYKAIFKGCFLHSEHSHKNIWFVLHPLFYPTRNGWSNLRTLFNSSSLHTHSQKIKSSGNCQVTWVWLPLTELRERAKTTCRVGREMLQPAEHVAMASSKNSRTCLQGTETWLQNSSQTASPLSLWFPPKNHPKPNKPRVYNSSVD